MPTKKPFERAAIFYRRSATIAAIVMGKLAMVASRRLRLGGGTTLPGTIARTIAPHILHDVTQSLADGVVLLTGTNGKTTTTRMLVAMMRAHHLHVLHNRAGANLVSGLTATALADCTLTGTPRSAIGLFETDEAALSQALAETRPRLVIIHNLFRDQLDRYGEVDTIAQAWRAALHTLPDTATVLLNADDPAVAYLGTDLSVPVYYYGLDDSHHATGASAHVADSHFCHRCGTRYTYPLLFYGHIGHYRCDACGYQRPTPHITLARLTLEATSGSMLYITYPGGGVAIHLPLPGLYNALNGLAAVAAGWLLGVPMGTIRNELEQFRAAFGRIEHVTAGTDGDGGGNGAPMLIALIKNPVGASETVRMVLANTTHTSPALHVLIIINDLAADGTDVSWLWDADFEPLASRTLHVTVSGTRAEDMAVRVRYAGVAVEHISIEPESARALDMALAALPHGETLFVLPTYTAMLQFRQELARRTWVRPFWEE